MIHRSWHSNTWASGFTSFSLTMASTCTPTVRKQCIASFSCAFLSTRDKSLLCSSSWLGLDLNDFVAGCWSRLWWLHSLSPARSTQIWSQKITQVPWLGIYISYIIMKFSYIYLHFASIHATTLDTQALVWFHPLLEILRFYVCSGWWCAQFVGHSSWFANLRIVRRSQKHKPKLRLMQFLVGSLNQPIYLLAQYSITQVSILFHLFQLDHWFLAELRCKIGPWFKYLNVSNLWSAKYMVSMPWSDFFRRTMYKGPMDRRFRMVLLFLMIWTVMVSNQSQGRWNWFIDWWLGWLVACVDFYCSLGRPRQSAKHFV